jgi:hypothetical protein
MLQDNVSLESLCILSWENIKAEDYMALVTTLQHNMTLKTLSLNHVGILQLIADKEKEMAKILNKNYGLERLPDFTQEPLAGDIGAILGLNEAGRRYLVQDGSSISKGVDVLSRVTDDINCMVICWRIRDFAAEAPSRY